MFTKTRSLNEDANVCLFSEDNMTLRLTHDGQGHTFVRHSSNVLKYMSMNGIHHQIDRVYYMSNHYIWKILHEMSKFI